MKISKLKFKVTDVVDAEKFRIISFGVKEVTANVDGIKYTDAFEDYIWIQTKCATEIGIAVHRYGAIIVPKEQLGASLNKFLVKVGDKYGKHEGTEAISTLTVDSEVEFVFESEDEDRVAVVGTAIVGTDVVG